MEKYHARVREFAQAKEKESVKHMFTTRLRSQVSQEILHANKSKPQTSKGSIGGEILEGTFESQKTSMARIKLPPFTQ